ncbi:hypothetical protein DL764_001536 [Monosporascus ibericus]|uniref:Peroxidase n=1 Tax=Monosporascus ibericus TaxID=155417 RepID=A0A4Q4TTW9_9PEZI|nr:hypothetical protein DL764_001536 [Monosporascus ibericus]
MAVSDRRAGGDHVSASGPGRIAAAEWVRTAFHDMAATTIDPRTNVRTGGLDGSIRYELGSLENAGPAFFTTLRFMQDFYTSRSSMADLIALGTYFAVRSCGGPVIPVKGGRVDATVAGPLGNIPMPQNSAFTFENQFARMGFSKAEMIQAVACGHTLGSVHAAEFPQIVPVGSAPPNDEVPMDSTVAAFDNRIVTEYISGNTTNPLVVGPSVQATRHSDFKVFNSDQNATVEAMASPAEFSSACQRILQKMIDTTPSSVTLSAPIQPYFVKPVNMQLTLNERVSTMRLSGLIRVRTTDLAGDSVSSVEVTFKDRNGGNNCGSAGCTFTASLLGATSGFDDTFVWFPIDRTIPTTTGISSFTLTLNMASGTRQTVDNNGNSYLLQDAILIQKPQSCVLSSIGSITVTAAVRNDRNSLPVNMVLSYKEPTGDANLPVPNLRTVTVAMTKGNCVGAYTFYNVQYTIPGDLAYASRIDVVSGSGDSALSDAFNSAGELGGTCQTFQNPSSSLCTTSQISTPPASSSTSMSVSASSSSTSTSVGAGSSSTSSSVGAGPSSTSSSVGAGSSSTSSSVGASSSSTSSSVGAGSSSTSSSVGASSSSLTSSASVTSTSSSVTVSSTTSSSTGAVETLHHRQTIGGYELVGCKKEATAGRALTGASFAYDGMTLETCMGNCSGFYYWGTEYGRECYCGDSLAATSDDAPLAECNMVCSGDDTQYCGAGNRIELYTSTAAQPTPTATLAPKPTVSAYVRVGCYEEIPHGRALTGAAYADDAMTLEMCASMCDAFHYWGAEYGRECYCGNTLDPLSTPASEEDCNMVCAGDRYEYCGGGHRLELYYSNTTNGPSHPPVVGNYSWSGCYSEPAGVRALAGKSYADDDMTLDSCASFCDGFALFGTEYGRECYCSDVLSEGSEEKDAGECRMVCAGNNKQLCGAGDRLSLYGIFDEQT